MSDSNIQKSLKVSEVTVDRILSHYLWNSPTPPKRENMMASITHAERLPVKIDAVDYMKNGAGRYASVADFRIFENFFKNTTLPPRGRPYSFDEIGNKIYGEEQFSKLKKDFENPEIGFTVSSSQYSTDISSADYVERAFIFGSTQVTVTETDRKKLQFIINPDGSKEIRNLRITPVKDNFDFKGGPSNTDGINDRIRKGMVDAANAAFKATIDPKGIGKTVPIEYANTGHLKFINVTDKQFKSLQVFKSEQEMSVKEGLPLLNSSGALINKLMHSPSLYTNEYINDIEKYFNDAGKMYRKTREIIDKDPNMMSQHEPERLPQYAQARSLTFDDMPPQAREICRQCRELLVEFDREEGITRSREDTDKIALAMGVQSYAAGLPEVQFIHIEEGGQINLGYESPQGMLKDTSIHTGKALAATLEENVAQSKQAEIDLALAAERQQQEILAYRQSQSMGRSI